MRLSDFDYSLPCDRIALHPLEPRDSSRLLVIEKTSGSLQHQHFSSLPDLLQPNDLLVLNNSKVIPARIFGTTSDGKKFEFLLLEELGASHWTCLVKKQKQALKQKFFRFFNSVRAELQEKNGILEIRFDAQEKDFWNFLEEFGRPPLPPYIKRETQAGDRQTYQTVYADIRGSVAAPTAGLHFTESLIQKIKGKGVEVEFVTLHVGYGTFAPIQADSLSNHRMHSERYEVSLKLASVIQKTKQQGGRVIAVGTTTLRALESMTVLGTRGRTDLFITPGYEFKTIDGLITNFHLPKSTLFVLVCALLGTERAHTVYQEAIREQYRFYSYGDAMLVL